MKTKTNKQTNKQTTEANGERVRKRSMNESRGKVFSTLLVIILMD